MAPNQNNFGIAPLVGVGYGGGGSYYAEQVIANSIQNNEFTRRRERIYDKYQINTDSFAQYRKDNGGSWVGRSIGIGLAVGAVVTGGLAIATAPIAFAAFVGAMAALFSAAITTSIKQSKDTRAYAHYLDRSEMEGRHKEHLKQAEVQAEKAVSPEIQKEKAVDAGLARHAAASAKSVMPDADMGNYSISQIREGVVQKPGNLNEQLQPQPARELVSAGKAGNEKG